jgi:serpin B
VRDRIARLAPVAAVLLAGVVTAHGAQAQKPALAPSCSAPSASGSQNYGQLVAAQNGFGFRLLKHLTAQNPSDDTFFSPTSVAIALGMAYDGAAGSTRAAMARTLGLVGMTPAQVRSRAPGLLEMLQPANGAGPFVANSLWAQRGTALRSAFIRHARSSYGATVRRIHLHAPSAPTVINSWVSCATRGRIPSIVDTIPPQTMLYLINAVYFSGAWQRPFTASNTHTQTFTTGAGGTLQVPMMTETEPLWYYKGRNFQMIALYYTHTQYMMVVLLPNRGTSLRSFAAGITAARWSRWIGHLELLPGTLFLPRISVRTDYGLVPTLTAMGMGNAFSDRADFSGMCVQPCRISDVRHEAFLKVDEKGTIAAAATSVGIEPTAVQVPQFTMTVNRPFVTGIFDRRTGANLFVGAINNPKG